MLGLRRLTVWMRAMNLTRECKSIHSTFVINAIDRVFAATTRTGGTSDSASDVNSAFSAGTNSSMHISSSQTNTRAKARLSPVSEHTGRNARQNSNAKQDELNPRRPDGVNGTSRTRGDSNPNSGSYIVSPTSHSASATNTMFARKKVASMKPMKSSLTAMLASSRSSSNPFAEMYAAISGRGESASTNIQIYFPYAKQPQGKPMNLNVRRDATVEEAIGFALWSYWEVGWLPKLDEGLSGEDDPKWATRLSAVGWILRITEDDGEVDDDFPREFHTAQVGFDD